MNRIGMWLFGLLAVLGMVSALTLIFCLTAFPAFGPYVNHRLANHDAAQSLVMLSFAAVLIGVFCGMGCADSVHDEELYRMGQERDARRCAAEAERMYQLQKYVAEAYDASPVLNGPLAHILWDQFLKYFNENNENLARWQASKLMWHLAYWDSGPIGHRSDAAGVSAVEKFKADLNIPAYAFLYS